MSDDGRYVHCSREELAGTIEKNGGGCYAHIAEGDCRCGQRHGSRLANTDYHYLDESGLPLFRVVRTPDKRFFQNAADGLGGWKKGLDGVRRVPYRLPELIAADPSQPVYIVEGEKDADNLARLREVVTTNPGGAGKWSYVAETARSVLAGRDVIIIGDNDEPGRKHVADVEARLRGAARSIRVVMPPAPHKDVSDHLAAGGSLADLVSIATETAANDAAPSAANDTEGPLTQWPALAKVAITGWDSIRKLAAESVTYTWEGIAMPGIIVGMTGAPGEGKTTLMFLLIAARLHTGDALSVLGFPVQPAPRDRYVVLIEAEHGEASASRKLIKSAEAIGAVPSDRLIMVARKSVTLGSPEWIDVRSMIAAGLVSDVFVDSLARFAPADSASEEEQAAIFDEVAAAIESSAHVAPTFWFVMHSRKGQSTGTTEDVSGSQQRGAQLDTLLSIHAERHKRTRQVTSAVVTFPKLREEPDEHPGRCQFAVVRTDGVRWAYVDIDDSGDETPDANAPVDEQLHAYLSAHGPMPKTKARTALGVGSPKLEAAITKLFQNHRIAIRKDGDSKILTAK